MSHASILLKDTHAQDPAYGPTAGWYARQPMSPTLISIVMVSRGGVGGAQLVGVDPSGQVN